MTKNMKMFSAIALAVVALGVAVYSANATSSSKDDLVCVPSNFAAEYYRNSLSLKTTVVPPLVDVELSNDEKFGLTKNERKYVLFFNPEIGKGLGFFIAIAKAVWERRRDVKFLLVEGRCGRREIQTLGKETLRNVGNIDFTENTPNIQRLFEQARITLFPSLYEETFGRVAAESMNASVPVIVSDRGALPETVGNGARVLSIPAKYQPDVHAVPSDVEIKPWLDALFRLWDDVDYYRKMQLQGWEQAKRWARERVADVYENLFLDLLERRKFNVNLR